METRGTDQAQTLGNEQLALLVGNAVTAVVSIATPYFLGLSADEAKAILSSGGHKKQMVVLLAPLFANADPHAAQRAYWEKVYALHFGVETDFSGAVIPTKPTDGKWRLIGIAKGLSMNHAAAMYEKILVAHDSQGSVWKYSEDLDAVVTKNARTSGESYFIWVQGGLEPDAAYLGKSTRDADPDGLIGETLLERLVHGSVRLVETKQHLDEKGITLCSGSRGSGGGVPYVDWYSADRKVFVGWYDVGDADPGDGLRQAVYA